MAASTVDTWATAIHDWIVRYILASALFIVPLACGGQQQPSNIPADVNLVETTRYYYGDVLTLAPDGEMPFGPPTKSLVKRQVIPAASKIIEEIWQGDEHFLTEMVRVAGSSTFNTSDTGGTFTGHLLFSGDEWRWDAWTYDISMSDGSGKIVGSGRLNVDAIITDKKFQSPDGTTRVVIRENLAKISESEFLEYLPPGFGLESNK